MKKLIFSLFFALSIIGFTNNLSAQKTEDLMAYEAYGRKIKPQEILTASQMQEHYNQLKVGDSIQVSFKTSVTSVCKMKGCWMTLKMPGEEEVMVKFKDYAFFVPKDIEGQEVIVEGKAYVKEVPIEELKHLAKDAGKSEAEIAAITTPEKQRSFLAEGVLIKE
ncbi:DUF4920 domain-containing protein [Zunongwangia sp. F363]|uniref:DUF4920 domain-containing protein n=1 Tax=Autumnicola tepida TaxID=3075595 RepID=A0ABU3CDM1_9FLAO|nr:DUF4920 domain-containing protein [Zunongwangia sp. F363]MDT0644439.1 DUF4920 domain-containing protein [Zunongwangia sp. F363]